MKITIKAASWHRNGIGGAGFWAVLFTDDENRGLFFASLFDAPGYCAVTCIDEAVKGNIKFAAGNSWRGDVYEQALRPAIAAFNANHGSNRMGPFSVLTDEAVEAHFAAAQEAERHEATVGAEAEEQERTFHVQGPTPLIRNGTNPLRERYEVRTFGGDCFGNPTGWRVIDRSRIRQGDLGIVEQFVGSIYEPDEREAAQRDAEALAAKLNEVQPQ